MSSSKKPVIHNLRDRIEARLRILNLNRLNEEKNLVTNSNATESNVTENDETEKNVTESNSNENNGTECNGTKSNRTDSDATESNETKSNGTESDTTESDATENDATEKNATENDATEKNATVSDGRREGEITINSIARPALPQGFAETLTDRCDESYHMHHKNRGYCVIFNHHSFDKNTGLNERSGTNKDRDAVAKLFGTLGFDVQTFDDLNVKEIHEQLDFFAHTVDHTDNDCFVMVFMSHGEDGSLYGKDTTFPSDKIYSSFTADSCSSLAGKPKMFFIQACRGEGLDKGVTLVHRSRDETDAGSFAMYKIPAHSDFLICWSTVPGHFSWRNTTNGSWFIQSLVKTFSLQSKTIDVLSMMTNVNRHMILNFESNCPTSVDMHKKKQTSCTINTLMRKIYIPPKCQ